MKKRTNSLGSSDSKLRPNLRSKVLEQRIPGTGANVIGGNLASPDASWNWLIQYAGAYCDERKHVARQATVVAAIAAPVQSAPDRPTIAE